jgi:hypothetical protein
MFFSQPNLLIQRFGWSVAMLDDDLIAVGAIYYLQNTGAVHVFQSNILFILQRHKQKQKTLFDFFSSSCLETTSNDWNEIFFSSGLSIG